MAGKTGGTTKTGGTKKLQWLMNTPVKTPAQRTVNKTNLQYLAKERNKQAPARDAALEHQKNMNEAKRVNPNPYRSGYAKPYSMTQQEWMVRRNAWKRQYGNVFQTEQERILRQNAAPVGYQYTPYAGWKWVGTGQTTPTTPAGYGSGGGGGYDYGGYDYGGGGGGGGGGEYTPDYWNSLMTWKIK